MQIESIDSCYSVESKSTLNDDMELTRENYFEHTERGGVPVLSSSLLKVALPISCGNVERVQAYYNKEVDDTKSKAMSFGTLLHQYAEDRTRFVIEPEWSVPDTVKEILDVTFKLIRDTRDEFPSDDLDAHQSELMTVANEKEWRMKNKDNIRMDFLRGKDLSGLTYWKFLNRTRDKIIVTGSKATLLNKVVDSIGKYGLKNPILEDNPSTTCLREFPISFVIRGNFPCKALLDKLEIDDNEKRCTIYDWKTTSNKVENFIYGYTYTVHNQTGIPEKVCYGGDYMKYKYYLSEHFYKLAAAEYLRSIGKEDYAIVFRFVAIETVAPYCIRVVTPHVVWSPIANDEFTNGMQVINDWFVKEGFLTF